MCDHLFIIKQNQFRSYRSAVLQIRQKKKGFAIHGVNLRGPNGSIHHENAIATRTKKQKEVHNA